LIITQIVFRHLLYFLISSCEPVECQPRFEGVQDILPGGDSSGKDFEGDGPFLTYIVYRSFKDPPPIPPLMH